MRLVAALLCLPLLAPGQASQNLDDVRKEPDPLRRFERALAFANTAAKEARQIVRDGGSRNDLQNLLGDLAQAAELSIESLRATGKKPSKLSRQYKKGELQMRDLLKQMNDLVLALSVDDRPPAEKVRDQIQTLHEQYLLGVMSK